MTLNQFKLLYFLLLTQHRNKKVSDVFKCFRTISEFQVNQFDELFYEANGTLHIGNKYYDTIMSYKRGLVFPNASSHIELTDFEHCLYFFQLTSVDIV